MTLVWVICQKRKSIARIQIETESHRLCFQALWRVGTVSVLSIGRPAVGVDVDSGFYDGP